VTTFILYTIELQSDIRSDRWREYSTL